MPRNANVATKGIDLRSRRRAVVGTHRSDGVVTCVELELCSCYGKFLTQKPRSLEKRCGILEKLSVHQPTFMRCFPLYRFAFSRTAHPSNPKPFCCMSTRQAQSPPHPHITTAAAAAVSSQYISRSISLRTRRTSNCMSVHEYVSVSVMIDRRELSSQRNYTGPYLRLSACIHDTKIRTSMQPSDPVHPIQSKPASQPRRARPSNYIHPSITPTPGPPTHVPTYLEATPEPRELLVQVRERVLQRLHGRGHVSVHRLHPHLDLVQQGVRVDVARELDLLVPEQLPD